MSHSVYVAGMGIISAIGNNIAESLDAFKSHRSGVGSVKFLETVHQSEFPLAEVKYSNEQLAELCGVPSHLSRTILLSLYAARQAMQSVPDSLFEKTRVGFLSASSVGGIDKTEFFFEDFLVMCLSLKYFFLFPFHYRAPDGTVDVRSPQVEIVDVRESQSNEEPSHQLHSFKKLVIEPALEVLPSSSSSKIHSFVSKS